MIHNTSKLSNVKVDFFIKDCIWFIVVFPSSNKMQRLWGWSGMILKRISQVWLYVLLKTFRYICSHLWIFMSYFSCSSLAFAYLRHIASNSKILLIGFERVFCYFWKLWLLKPLLIFLRLCAIYRKKAILLNLYEWCSLKTVF